MTTSASCPWHRVGVLWLALGVLMAAVASGVGILSLAVAGRDPLVVSDQDYQALRDEFRLTQPAAHDDER